MRSSVGKAFSRGVVSRRRAAALAGVIASAVGAVSAPAALNPPFNATLVGTWDGWVGDYADVWGEGNYAYVSHFGDAGVDILDISNPANPVRVAEVRPDPPNQDASSQDVQTGDGLLFIGLEYNANDSVLIVDVRDPANPIQLTLVRIVNFEDTHNVFYDKPNKMLYLANSRSPARVAIVDLRNYDPDNAPATITTPLWVINGIGTSLVHDITVQNNILYAFAWNGGVWLYDVTNVVTTAPVFLASAPGSSTHSGWATDDGKFIVTGEERSGGGIKVFEIINNAGSYSLVLRDQFALPLTEAFCVHNQANVGYRSYHAWYQDGLRVYDINPTTGLLTLFASYDTYPGEVSSYDGAWGVYPWLGQDKVLVLDIATGFFIINVGGGAEIRLPYGLPESAHPVLETPVQVQIVEVGSTAVDTGSVTLHTNVSSRGETQVTMTPLGGGIYEGNLPRVPCGDTVSFYFSAGIAGGGSVKNPLNAPASSHTIGSQSAIIEHFRNNFEQHLGWVTPAPGDSATSGFWTRVDPVGTSAQPEDDNPSGTGTFCYVTGQGAVGGADGAADVDNGITTLTSAAFNAATEPGLSVGYHRWYSNNRGAAPGQDQMDISISNNGGTSWVPLETVTENANAWVEKRFLVSDFVTPTNNMKLRFIASDLGTGSIVEAGVDDFVIVKLVCSELAGDADGDGDVAPDDYANFDDCMAGPSAGVLPGCAIYDADFDNDVDMFDYLAIHEDYTG